MAIEINPNFTGESLEALDTDVLRKLWKKSVDVAEQETDFFMKFEGAREDSIIETVTDTSKGAGQRISFSSMSGFYQDGKHGSDYFELAADYETVKTGTNSLVVDWVRNGVRWDERMEEYLGLRRELTSKFPVEMGKWVGRKKCRATWMSLREKGGSENYSIAGGKATQDDLTSADTLGWSDIVDTTVVLKNRGASPAHIAKRGKNSIKGFIVASTTTGLLGLKNDDQYLEVQQQAGPDSYANELFHGGYEMVDGNYICQYQDLDHDNGFMGSPVNPKLKLSAAIAAGTTSFTFTGGDGSANTMWAQDFPNFAFQFNVSDVLAAGTADFYVLVVNASNAATDPGKIGFYKCVGNDGHSITVTERLAAAAAGIANTTVGAVTWETGVWTGLHTDQHDAGSMVYLANSKGQPIGKSAFLGACSMRRGYGKYRNERMEDSKEGGFIQETYVATVFGHAPKMRADGMFPNFQVVTHAINYPGTPIPTIV